MGSSIIRPVALGRKNYLFAGSHKAAERAAGIYSFFAICKKHDVNPYEWVKYVLENILDINHKNIRDLYPLIRIDRKSTRLNSSHVAISYAVFCLKKKTKQKQQDH